MTESDVLHPLTTTSVDDEMAMLDRWWRACNYLSVGMIYLTDNPLLREPLKPEHVKRRLLGHWGASPALSFVWAHLNRVIRRDGLDVIFIAGPGHGAPGVLGPAYLEGILTPRSIPTRPRTPKGCRSSSSSSLSPATSGAT